MYTVFYFNFSNLLLCAVLFEITYIYVKVYTAFAFEKLSGAQFSANNSKVLIYLTLICQKSSIDQQGFCHTEVCLTFSRLTAKNSEIITKFRGCSLKIQHESVFYLNFNHYMDRACTVFPHIVSSLEKFPLLEEFPDLVRKLFKFSLHKGKIMRKLYEIFNLL